MMKTIVMMTALLAAGACKKSDGGDKAGGADSAACTTAIDKAVTTMIEGRKKMVAERAAQSGQPAPADGGALDQVGAKLRPVLIARCTEDKWSPEVVACFANASDFPSMKACEKNLTPEQNRKRQEEVMKVMMGGAGGPGMGGPGMHGGTMPPPSTGSGATGSATGSGG